MQALGGPAAILLLCASPAAAAHADGAFAPCPAVIFLGPEHPALTEPEKRLVCGDPEREGWRRVPLQEAEYFMRAFLQERAYLHPRFETDGSVLRVWSGERSRIRGVYAEGLPPEVRLSRRRGLLGSWLTPASLDELQSWLRSQLEYRGRGCPEVRATADADTAIVRVRVEPGPPTRVERIQAASTGDIDPGVFRRFEAFEYGRPLDLRLLNLTSNRVIEQDLFLSAYYDLSCSSGSLSISQRVVTAPPHLVSAGAGFDSEELFKAQLRWRNSRIGWRASAFDARLSASQRIQAAQAELRWYPRPAARWFLSPHADGRHDAELRYDAAFANATIEPGADLDNQVLRLSLQGGPGWAYVRTLRGAGPPDEAVIALHARVSLVSHLYEYYLRDPRSGWYATLEAASRQRGVYSPFTAHRLALTAQRLWNLGQYDPHLLVLGWRTMSGTTLADAASAAPGALPAPLRFFLGGDADLRGFSRQELPVSGDGYLTAVYQGLELRAAILPQHVEPLLFVDGAMTGRNGLELERTLYWSPGLGVRWGSPIGALRATLARSFVARRDAAIEDRSHWQFFFSLGQEF